MASTTGDGAEQAEPKAPAKALPRPPTKEPARPTAAEGAPAPAAGFGPPQLDAGGSAGGEAPPDAEAPKDAAPVLAIPPVAVPKVRSGPASTRSIKGETTASDYVAPREIPAHTPRPTESVDAKVVIDVPDGAAGGAEGEAEVVEMRQRRRAPTMKIDRSKLNELKQIEGARERSTQPDLPAMPNGGALPPPHATPSDASLRPASVGIDGRGTDGRGPLARARPEPRSARGIGWAVVALATVVVGGGVAAIALGLVPGLGPTPPPEREPAAEPPAASPQPAAAPSPTPTPAETASAEPTPSVVPTVEASAAPAASPATPPTATAPYKPPFQNGPGPGRPPPYSRPRPKSDIPQGI